MPQRFGLCDDLSVGKTWVNMPTSMEASGVRKERYKAFTYDGSPASRRVRPVSQANEAKLGWPAH
jgi:hypothetical protein